MSVLLWLSTLPCYSGKRKRRSVGIVVFDMQVFPAAAAGGGWREGGLHLHMSLASQPSSQQLLLRWLVGGSL